MQAEKLPVPSRRPIVRTLACLAFLLPTLPAKSLPAQLPLEPLHDSGQSVTGAFEGWYRNADGTLNILIGYFNRNLKEEIDIPVGPANDIEPGGPDRGQPTHFLARRQWGVFTVTVPADFGDRRLTWTLVANGKTTVVPVNLNPLWEVSPFAEVGIGNTPPIISFDEGGAGAQGPRPFSVARTVTMPGPLALSVWVADDAKVAPGAKTPKTPPVTVAWSKFRGPGEVVFDNPKPPVEQTEGKGAAAAVFNGRAKTTATFSEPGEYVVLVVANDWSGEGGRGFQCCWTTAQVKVSVKPGP